jgi:pyruvate dehydrogenase E1 component
MATNQNATIQDNGLTETDPLETQEWLDALTAVIENEGTERAHFLLEAMIDKARRSGSNRLRQYHPNAFAV